MECLADPGGPKKCHLFFEWSQIDFILTLFLVVTVIGVNIADRCFIKRVCLYLVATFLLLFFLFSFCFVLLFVSDLKAASQSASDFCLFVKVQKRTFVTKTIYRCLIRQQKLLIKKNKEFKEIIKMAEILNMFRESVWFRGSGGVHKDMIVVDRQAQEKAKEQPFLNFCLHFRKLFTNFVILYSVKIP
jgi:hypothetical protein